MSALSSLETCLTQHSHTSGSTGIPKPLTWTHESVARHHRSSALEAPDGFSSLNSAYLGKRVLSTLPPFHVGPPAENIPPGAQANSNREPD